MLHFVQRRIGRRIALVVGLAIAIGGLGGLFLLLAETSRTQEETEQRLATVLAEMISASFQSFDPRQGQHPIADIVARVADREEVQTLEVFDDHGRIRWSADSRRRGSMVESEVLRAILTSTAARLAPKPPGASGDERATLSHSADRTDVVLPLRKTSGCLPCHNKSSDPIGGVHMATSHRKLLASSADFPRQAAMLVFLAVILLTAFLLSLINRMVVARISKLVTAMSKAEEGDFMVRAEVASNDEIGLLASTFNKMLAKITDLRVERIDKEREMSVVLDELSLKQEIAKRGELLEAANERLNARLNQLAFLYNLGRDLASELDLDTLLDRFSLLVNTKLGVPEFAVLLVDGSKGFAEVMKARGFDKDDVVDKPFDVNLGLTGEASRTRKPVYVPNAAADKREAPYRKKAGSGSVLCVPVIYQESLAGLLIFSSPVIDAFREEDRELFVAVGNQAALALANAQLFQKTLALSNTDGLTGILNRRAMETRLDLEWSRALRDAMPLSLLMIDIDHFKVYNDQHGHQLGDETLRRVARILERNIRKVDAVARYGGEEFVVILPRASRREAIEVANKLRRSVEQADFVQGYMQPLGRVTISCGVATAPDEGDSIAALIAAADEALFRAKQNGRNQVVASRKRGPSEASGNHAAPDETAELDDTDTWNDDSAYS